MPIANVNGINIDYKVEGQGEPLIMISGAGANKSAWRYQTRVFKKHYRAITFDHRGVGKSDKPAGPYNFKTMADDTIGLMDNLNIEKAHIMGMSAGGIVAQELAIHHPERVNKLVLACTFARRDEISGFSSEVENAIKTYEESSHDKSSLRRFASVFMDLQINKWSYRIFILPLFKIVIRFMSMSALDANVGAQFAAVEMHDTADRLGMIKAPTLVITGTEDRVIKPSSSEVIASLVPNAKLVTMAGGGHSFPMEMSDEFNREVLDFLKN